MFGKLFRRREPGDELLNNWFTWANRIRKAKEEQDISLIRGIFTSHLLNKQDQHNRKGRKAG